MHGGIPFVPAIVAPIDVFLAFHPTGPLTVCQILATIITLPGNADRSSTTFFQTIIVNIHVSRCALRHASTGRRKYKQCNNKCDHTV